MNAFEQKAHDILANHFKYSSIYTGGYKNLKYEHIYYKLLNKFPFLKTNKGSKFFPAIARMYINDELFLDSICKKINNIIPIIINKFYSEYNDNLNGLTSYKIINKHNIKRN